MFYIGGGVACNMQWDFESIGQILQDAICDPKERPRSRPDCPLFDVYCGKNVPGQTWEKFKSKKNEKGSVSLKTKLECLLLPSTTSEELAALAADIAKRGDGKTTYLKLKQKPTDQQEWLLDTISGEIHNGAHFPLFLVTQNKSSRSQEAEHRRWQKRSQSDRGRGRGKGNDDRHGKGNGKGRGRGRGACGQMHSPVSAATPDLAANDQAAQAADGANLPWGDARWASGRDRSWWDWSSEWSNGDWQSDASWWH